MKVLSAIGRFFARIGRWIKETAWIQPLLIVGAIFAVIFAIPHIINGVKGWFNNSDSTNTFYAQYRLSLTGADKVKDGEDVGSSEVDKFFTYLADSSKEEDLLKMVGKDRFFVAFVEKDNGSAADNLCGGLKTLKDKWNNAEFKDSLSGKGSFKLITIYTDTKNSDGENLFDMVWKNHIGLFEDLSDGNNLPNTYYAKNEGYGADKYASTFIGSDEKTEECPMSTPLLMYFDFSKDEQGNPNNPNTNTTIKGLSDVIFSVEGDDDWERARSLKDCWIHANKFGKIINN
ncbi:MAG: hypothetical protein IJR08_00375 [Bacilli bacterium]|nr:hypothetical protein [Bacilli bacterium]